MLENDGKRSLDEYLRLFRRNLGLIVACVVVGGLGALTVSLLQDKEYQATAKLDFNSESAQLQSIGAAATPSFQPEKTAAADATLVTSPEVIAAVAASVGSSGGDDDLGDQVSATVEPDTNLVAVTATAGTPQAAADIANAFAIETATRAKRQQSKQYKDAANKLRARASRLDPDVDSATIAAYSDSISNLLALSELSEPVQISEKASPPSTPTSPRPVRNTIVGVFAGLFVGLALSLFRGRSGHRVDDIGRVARELELPIAAHVRSESLGMAATGDEGLPIETDLFEAFRILRVNLQFLEESNLPLRSFAVTSPLSGEGKSTVAIGLAVASAMSGKDTLLVDCDLRRPVLSERLGAAKSPGLSDLLAARCKISESVQEVDHLRGEVGGRLALIAAGTHEAFPAEVLARSSLSDVLHEVGDDYDTVICDCAPLLPVGDTLEVVPAIEGVLLCVRINQTTESEAAAACDALQRLPTKPTAIVSTGVTKRDSAGYYGGYGQGQGAIDYRVNASQSAV